MRKRITRSFSMFLKWHWVCHSIADISTSTPRAIFLSNEKIVTKNVRYKRLCHCYSMTILAISDVIYSKFNFN